MLKRIIPVAAVAVLLVAFAVVPVIALLPNGQQAPDFQLADLSSNMHSLSDYQGKVVVIDFFGADCSYCKSSAADDLVPLYNNYYQGDARVQFLSVETSGASAAYTRSNFVQPTGITWPVLVGGTNLVSSYGIASVPTMYVIDSTGKVALAMEYPVNVQTLKSTIDQLVGGPGWGAWSNIGGILASGTSPAVCAHDANSLDVFVQGTDHALWHKHYQSTSGWSDWESLGGYLNSSPAATAQANGKVDVFVRGSSGELWQREYTNGWSDWQSLGGQLTSSPAATAQANGKVDVFVRGSSGELWQREYTNGWSAWTSVGGYLTSDPAAVSRSAGKITVFVRGGSGSLWSTSTTDGGATWSGWNEIGGQLLDGTGPTAYAWGNDRIGWLVTGTNNVLYHMWDDSTGRHGWEKLDGYLTSSPGATSASSGSISVFVRGSTGALWQREYNSG